VSASGETRQRGRLLAVDATLTAASSPDAIHPSTFPVATASCFAICGGVSQRSATAPPFGGASGRAARLPLSCFTVQFVTRDTRISHRIDCAIERVHEPHNRTMFAAFILRRTHAPKIENAVPGVCGSVRR